MTFTQLIEKIKTFEFDEVRKEEPDYLEAVVRVDKVEGIESILNEFFGMPFKPAGQAPDQKAKKHTEALGGIWADQTLYLAEQEGSLFCAMFWPWSNGELTTLKIAQYQRK